jgi:hypothetical protein
VVHITLSVKRKRCERLAAFIGHLLYMTGAVQKLVAIAAVALVVCSGYGRPCWAQGPPNADEYGIYAALFRQKQADNENSQIVINDMTTTDDFSEKRVDIRNVDPAIQDLVKRFPQLARETALDFFTKNQTSWTLRNEFNLKAEIVLITTYETKKFFKGDIEEGWKLFHTTYPRAGSIDTLSRVGFNKEKTQALIYYTYVCGGLCGQGQYILLTRKDDKWTIEKESGTWIS